VATSIKNSTGLNHQAGRVNLAGNDSLRLDLYPSFGKYDTIKFPRNDHVIAFDLAFNGGDWYTINDVTMSVSPDPRYYNLLSLTPSIPIPPPSPTSVRAGDGAHLLTCEVCSVVEAEERALSDLLRTQLTRRAAPDALKERLAAEYGAQPERTLQPRKLRPHPQLTAAVGALAACGIAVPMMSGRGLGHTGGTLDKLESIPGFRTNLSLAEAKAQVQKLGCALIGQTAEIAPADRKLYALRDVTATVESIPLISASIMSKKLAEGLNGLVLDVKNGSGAFLPEVARGLELAKTMIALGEDRGCPTVALITAMDRPLGRACGNVLETEEAILALRGEGPPDLLEVTYALGVEMLLQGGIEKNTKKARKKLETAIESGLAAEKFEQIIEAQGGNPKAVEDPSVLPQALAVEVYAAPRTGVVQRVEPRTIGRAIIALGGGRRTVDDIIDPTVGFVITVKPGDKVLEGEPIASVFAKDADGIRPPVHDDADGHCESRENTAHDERGHGGDRRRAQGGVRRIIGGFIFGRGLAVEPTARDERDGQGAHERFAGFPAESRRPSNCRLRLCSTLRNRPWGSGSESPNSGRAPEKNGLALPPELAPPSDSA